MYLRFYGLREEPFGVTPDPRFLFASPTYQEAQATLEYGIRSGRGFTALIAKPGMGKTTLLFHLLERYATQARTAFIFLTQCDSREFLRYLMTELGTSTGETDFVRLQEQFGQLLVREAQAGKKVIAVVDEAQNLDVSVLETVRLLSDFETPRAKLLHIILTGQPELADRLASPALLQLRQRISHLVRLEPLSAAEVSRYIDHRLQVAGYRGAPLFTAEARALIVERSEGIPRTINNLCFNALSLGFATGQRSIGAEILREVSADLDFESIIRARDEERAAAATLEAASAASPSAAPAAMAEAAPQPASAETNAIPAAPPAEAEEAGPSGETALPVEAPAEMAAPTLAQTAETAPMEEVPPAVVAAASSQEPEVETLPAGPVLVRDPLPRVAAASEAEEVASAEVGNLALRIVPAESAAEPAAAPINGSGTAIPAPSKPAKQGGETSGNGMAKPAAADKGKASVDVEALAADCALFGMEAPKRWKRPTGRVPIPGSTPAASPKAAAAPGPARTNVTRPGTPLTTPGNRVAPANGSAARTPVARMGPTRVPAKTVQDGKVWPLRSPAAADARRRRRQRSLYLAAGASLLLLLILFWLLGSSQPAAPSEKGTEANATQPTTTPSEATAGGATNISDSSVLDVVEELPAPGQQENVSNSRPAVVMRGTRAGEQLLRRVDPVYPAAARANHIQGPVVLEATIGTHGFLRHIRVLSGDPLLADSVLDAVRGWRYRPRSVRGRAVESETRIVVNFQLVPGPGNSTQNR